MERKFVILYQDEDFIAINKPTGILVHRTRISEDLQFGHPKSGEQLLIYAPLDEAFQRAMDFLEF